MADKRTFYVLDTISNDGAVIETIPPEAPEGWRFFKGQSLSADFPAGATMKFSKDFPKQRKLYDFVANTLSLLIASKKVKDTLEACGVANCEYLPVAIKDHKDKIVGSDYFIIHPLGGEQGINLEKSVYDKDAFDENRIRRMHSLILNQELISSTALLFRFQPFMRHYFVNETIGKALKKAKVPGFRLLKADGWDGSYTNLNNL